MLLLVVGLHTDLQVLKAINDLGPDMSPDVLVNPFLRVDPRSAAAAAAFGPGGVDPLDAAAHQRGG